MIPVNNDILIARAILEHLNTWPGKPCEIRLESMTRKPIAFSMAMQQLSGTRVLRQYVDGSFVGAWPFAVYVRLGSSVDTSKRFEAVSHLESIGEWMDETPLPVLGGARIAESIEMTSLPSIAGTYEDGSVDYQAVFQLTYKQKRSE